jgi:hypothetical protein
MERRAAALGYRLSDLGGQEVGWDQGLTVPTGPVWAKIEIEKSLTGRLFSFLYKVPQIEMEVASTTRRNSYQIVPELAKAGFLLSPLVDSTEGFKKFSESGGGEAVKSILFHVKGPGIMYSSRVATHFYTLTTPRFHKQLDTGRETLLRGWAAGVRSCTFPPEVQWDERARDYVLVAHAPCVLDYRIPSGSNCLRVRFGLRDDSTGSDGAEFQIRQNSKVLYSKFMKPEDSAVEQELTVASGKVELVTLPGPNNNNIYDHTYWSVVEPRHAQAAVK